MTLSNKESKVYISQEDITFVCCVCVFVIYIYFFFGVKVDELKRERIYFENVHQENKNKWSEIQAQSCEFKNNKQKSTSKRTQECYLVYLFSIHMFRTLVNKQKNIKKWKWEEFSVHFNDSSQQFETCKKARRK